MTRFALLALLAALLLLVVRPAPATAADASHAQPAVAVQPGGLDTADVVLVRHGGHDRRHGGFSRHDRHHRFSFGFGHGHGFRHHYYRPYSYYPRSYYPSCYRVYDPYWGRAYVRCYPYRW